MNILLLPIRFVLVALLICISFPIYWVFGDTHPFSLWWIRLVGFGPQSKNRTPRRRSSDIPIVRIPPAPEAHPIFQEPPDTSALPIPAARELRPQIKVRLRPDTYNQFKLIKERMFSFFEFDPNDKQDV